MREGVAVWPTKNQRIIGRLSLIKQHQVMFLAWLPYSQGSLNKDGTFYSSATAEKSATQSAKGTKSCCNVLLMYNCKRCAFKAACSRRNKQWPNYQHHQIRLCNLLAKVFHLHLSTHYTPGAFAVQMLRQCYPCWHQSTATSIHQYCSFAVSCGQNSPINFMYICLFHHTAGSLQQPSLSHCKACWAG